MPLINCRVELSLNWIERCILTVANTETLKITDAKLYVLIITLSAEDNVKLSKLVSKGFKQYDKIRKISTGQGDDCTYGYLLDFAYFEKKIQINCSWFKETKNFRCWLNSNSTNYFYWQRVMIYYILEESREAILEFAKGTTKVL